MTRTRFVVLAAVWLLAPLGACSGGGHASDLPQCSDGIDNDGDGLIDFPADPGCTSPQDDSEDSPPSPQCSDGRDNDGDGKVDYPNDPGCPSPLGNSEVDDCPHGTGCPQCSNGVDDDGNGLTDYPSDPGCMSAGDPVEAPLDTTACGDALTVQSLPTSFEAVGAIETPASDLMGSCGGSGGEAVYELTIGKPSVLVASTNDASTTLDAVIYIRDMTCTDPSKEVGCAAPGSDATGSTLTVAVNAGTYFIVVDGVTTGSTGNYVLTVNEYAGVGTSCTGSGDTITCGPGLLCQATGSGSGTCGEPQCSDGIDNDGDGKIDYPNDPGCTSPSDNSEIDDCPSGPMCPQCGNGIDDDGDGLIDYPADPQCKSASGTSEACTTVDPVVALTAAVTTGDTTGASDDFEPTCASENGAPDLTYEVVLPALTTFTASIDTGFNWDPVLQLLGSTCMGAEVACDDFDDGFTNAPLAAGTYYLNVDGDTVDDFGAFTLTVSGTIVGGQSCESALAQAGALACDSGYICKGTVGSRTCQVAECNDGIDNDGDGKIDYPNDPGCASPSGDSEVDDCPSGPTCPACSNGIDDDGDGKTDWPADPSCTSAAGITEACNSTDVVTEITTATVSGDTTTANDDYEPACADDTGAPDLTYRLDLPGTATFSVTFTASNPEEFDDPVLELLNSTCGGTAVTCDESDGVIMKNNLAAGTYYLVVDGDFDFEYGAYTLAIAGTIKSGQACTSPLYTAGALTCATGTTCTAGTCQ